MRYLWLVSLVIFVFSSYAQQNDTEKKEINPFMDWIPKKVEQPSQKTSDKEYEKESEEVSFDIEVEGIVWNAKVPCAIINGELYKVGDEVQGGKIIDIDKEGVSIKCKKRIYIFPVRKKEAEK